MTEKKSAQKKVPCHFPWSSIYVSPTGDVRHCCATNLNKLGNLKEQTIEEIWNSDLYQLVRKKVDEGDFDGAYCNSNCEGLRTGDGYPWTEGTTGGKAIEGVELAPEVSENENLAISNFENGVAKVDHMPTQLHIEFSDNCNFRCVMCFYEFKPPYNNVPDDVVTQLQDMSKYATHVALMGGEVFMNKNDLKFIDNYDAPEGASMGFITNASYLDAKMIDRIRKYKRMGMQISIDGTVKEVFEKVRVRGKWDVVDANIHRVVKAANEMKAEGNQWDIHLSYVVMASNIGNVPHAVQYAIDLGVPIYFNPVKGFHLFDENIYVYKDALTSVGDWKQYLEDAYAILEENKETYEHYDRVLVRIKDIEQFIEGPKIKAPRSIANAVKRIVPDPDNGKAQGLSKHDSDVAQLFEVYFNWRTGKSSLKNTISYLGFKGYRRLRSRMDGKKQKPTKRTDKVQTA